MDDELEVNSIERFSKKSDRLILEEHGSCEVPAGCGGVVLRWLSFADGLPVSVRIRLHLAHVTVWCNGTESRNGHVNAPFGPGLLAIQIDERESDFDWFSVETYHSSHRFGPKLDRRGVPEMSACNDGTWKYTVEPPSIDWVSADFTDDHWQAMSVTSMPLDKLSKDDHWQFSWLNESDRTVFSIPRSRVWIRKRFDLSAYAQDEA